MGLVAAARLAAGTGAGRATGAGLDIARLIIVRGSSLLGSTLLLGGTLLGGSALNLGLGNLNVDLATTELGLVVGSGSGLGLGHGLVGNEAVAEGAGSTGDDVSLQPSW